MTMFSTTLSQPGSIVAAPELPDLFSATETRRGRFAFITRDPATSIGVVLLSILVLIAIFAPFLATHNPNALNPTARLNSPSAAHLFGTDMLGRDIYSRAVYGARVSLMVGLFVAIASTFFGFIFGLTSGFIRWTDGPIMRLMDGLMSIPSILLAITLITLFKPNIFNVILAITIAEIPRTSRLVRSAVLSLREQPFVDAAITSGTRTPMIIIRHILPNTLGPVTVQATYVCASAMIIESVLSFIGAGLPPSIPSWGNILAEGRALWLVKPYIIFFPAVFLSITVLAVNLLGDGLRDRLDPHSNRDI